MKRLLLILALASVAIAQTPRSVVLSWTDTNPAGTTFNVYKATGVCSVASVFSKVNPAAVTVKTYTDLAVSGGNTYCYQVTAVSGSLESARSNTTNPALSPDLAPPTNLTSVVVTVIVSIPVAPVPGP